MVIDEKTSSSHTILTGGQRRDETRSSSAVSNTGKAGLYTKSGILWNGVEYLERCMKIQVNSTNVDSFFAESDLVHSFGLVTKMMMRLGYCSVNKVCVYFYY